MVKYQTTFVYFQKEDTLDKKVVLTAAIVVAFLLSSSILVKSMEELYFGVDSSGTTAGVFFCRALHVTPLSMCHVLPPTAIFMVPPSSCRSRSSTFMRASSPSPLLG